MPPNISKHAETVIIGSGPAGINAAIQLARSGGSCVLIDENQAIGGAIFRQPQKQGGSEAPEELKDRTKRRAKELLRSFEEVKGAITMALETQVVGADADTRELTLLQGQRLSTLSFDRLIVAAGCYEWPLPFPGWTLPGVSSVGGLQLQVKSGAVRPGRRVVLAGTGPLLLVAAKNLHEAGVQVLGVFEMGRRWELVSQFPALLSNVELLREGVSLMGYLRAAGIPIHHGWGIVEARGEGELSSVVVAPHDAQGRAVRGQARTLEADCLGTSFGFIPRVQLTQLLGCKHELSEMDRAAVPTVDDWQRTSLPGVYVAGDVGGVFGSEAASEQGKLAALGSLVDMGKLSVEDAERQARPARSRLLAIQRFRRAFARFSALRPGLLEMPQPETVVCRCEAVTSGQLAQAIQDGSNTFSHLKMATRAGMGDCQGKMCGQYCVEILVRMTGRSREQVGSLRPRFPLAPIPFAAFLDEEGGVS